MSKLSMIQSKLDKMLEGVSDDSSIEEEIHNIRAKLQRKTNKKEQKKQGQQQKKKNNEENEEEKQEKQKKKHKKEDEESSSGSDDTDTETENTETEEDDDTDSVVSNLRDEEIILTGYGADQQGVDSISIDFEMEQDSQYIDDSKDPKINKKSDKKSDKKSKKKSNKKNNKMNLIDLNSIYDNEQVLTRQQIQKLEQYDY